MKRFARSVGILLVAGAATAVGFFGFNAFQDVKFARAEDRVESTRQQLAQVEDLASVFRHVGQVVEPSVVNIEVHKRVPGRFHGNMPFDENMRRFFMPDRDGDGQPDMPDMPDVPDLQIPDRPQEQIGTGSGVIMEVQDGSAFILTNNHVVGGATSMTITLYDGRKITDTKVLGADPKTDLAVVRVKAERVIPAKWGNSDELRKGDWIMAFGSPFGYVGSMTHGIVSALNRQAGILGQQGYEDFIQVDAPINPGNSGGPLVNIRGEVVGINTAIASRTGGFQGIGFAIPSNMAKGVYAELKDKGKVVRGWLGVGIDDVAKVEDVAKGGYTGDKGVLVKQTFPNTPASGKLRPGDVITGINGKPVESVLQLRSTIADTAPGKDVTLKVFRGGKTEDVVLTVGQQPENVLASLQGGQPDQFAAPSGETTLQDVGLKLADPSGELTKRFSLPADRKGAVVTDVSQRSLAAMSGIKPGDLITSVNGKAVATAKDAADALDKADLKKGVVVMVSNREADSQVVLKKED